MRVHLAATTGISGQLGYRGGAPWGDQPECMEVANKAADEILAAAEGHVWIAGWRTAQQLRTVVAGLEKSTPLLTHDPYGRPSDLIEQATSLHFGCDVWIMGGGKTFAEYMSYVDVHHITVVPYDGPADTWLRPIIPGWVNKI